MSNCQSAELLRLAATEGDTRATSVPDWASSLVVANELDATIWVSYRASPAPSATDHDLAIPGSALYSRPLPGGKGRQIVAIVDYPGAVPAGDAGLIVTIEVTESQLGASVGPLS